MKFKTKEHIVLSSVIAFICTVLYAVHMKIGGLLSGGVYSEPHPWSELVVGWVE